MPEDDFYLDSKLWYPCLFVSYKGKTCQAWFFPGISCRHVKSKRFIRALLQPWLFSSNGQLDFQSKQLGNTMYSQSKLISKQVA